MAVTVLGPGGYPKAPGGSFAGKSVGGGTKVYTQTFTVLGPGGYSRPPWGSFAGKSAGGGGGKTFTQVFTVLGPGGYSRPPWGAFGGKSGGGSGSKSFTQVFTVLGPGGYSRPPWGPFGGKPASVVPIPPPPAIAPVPYQIYGGPLKAGPHGYGTAMSFTGGGDSPTVYDWSDDND